MEERLGASFFFSRGGGDVSHAGKFFTSIAVQLANSIPSLRHYIYDAISHRKDIASQSFRDQWSQLILCPLSKLGSDSSPSSYLLVIDALDECDRDEHIRMVLQLLAEARTLRTVRLRILLTSRPEIPIRHGFYQIPGAQRQDFVLHNVLPTIINHDISLFLEYNLGIIRQEWTLGADWPGEVVLRQLVQHACGLFIWAATACRFIREGKRFARRRLDTILKGSSGAALTAPDQHLDEMYLTVLRHSISPEYSDEEREEICDMLKHTLGSVVVLLSPLSSSSLSRLLHLPKEKVDQGLEDLYAILDIPNDPTRQLRLHHPSFRDFLLNKDRCGDFWVDEKEAHQILAASCIQLMSQTLKKDICEMHTPGSQASQVESSWIEKCLPPEVQYACLYWVQHLQRVSAQLYDEVYLFLQNQLLHWLEALAWIGKTSEGIIALSSLESYLTVSYFNRLLLNLAKLIMKGDKNPNLQMFIHDAKRFVLYNRSVIEQAPLQIYCSALVFSPEKSIIRKQFLNCIPAWIQTKPKVQEDWSTALQTLEGHSSSVDSVAFSSDGKQVVSGSCDKTLRLWDAVTGAVLQTLEGHSDEVYSVAFSLNGNQVVSGSRDKIIRLWDAVTGAVLQILKSHSDSVYSVAFSPNGKQVLSGSRDKKILLWDAVTGAVLQTFKGHLGWVKSVAFSPDSKLIVSGSEDKTVRVWDTETGRALHRLEGHSGWVESVAFSPDGKLIVSGSEDKTVRVWDTETGRALHRLEGHSGWVQSVAFSPDGKLVVSGSHDETVRLWGTETGRVSYTLKGHSDCVKSVAFSPDGKQVVSGSCDKTVRLWDSRTGATLQTLESHSDEVGIVAFSPDGKQVVSGSNDMTARLWDAETGTVRYTLEGDSDWIKSVAFSLDGKLVVSGGGEIVRLWDTVTGAILQTFKGHLGWVNSVAFSPDGKLVVSGSEDKTVRVWDTKTGKILHRLEGHLARIRSVAYSPDSKLTASVSNDKTIRIWDIERGAVRYTLKGHLDWVDSVAFSPNSKLVLSGSNDMTARLWDAETGIVQYIFEGHLALVNSVAFSPDGKLVASGSAETIRVWDAETGAVCYTLEGHSDCIKTVAFSTDDNFVNTLFVSHDWIVEGEAYILCLPPDYRATCVAVCDRTVVLGHSSGRVSFLAFKGGSKFI
jgi:uncharacterized delta-60 repeat protein